MDAHQTRKQPREERKVVTPPLPSPHLRSNFTPGSTNRRKVLPERRKQRGEPAQTLAQHQNSAMETKRTLTLHFVGVGLLAPRHRGEDDGGGGDGWGGLMMMMVDERR